MESSDIDDDNSQSPDPHTPTDESPSKWLPGIWQDGHRTSAFTPYNKAPQQHHQGLTPSSVHYCTVLTNLQRGNTKADNPAPQPTDINFYTLAGQGEITAKDVELNGDVDTVDANGLTGLHWAAAYGQYSSVELLIENGATVEMLGPNSETPLLLAANGGHHDVTRYLLSKGSDVNHTDDLGNTALMYAAGGNHPHTCNELLLERADLTMENFNEDTAFMLAVRNKSTLALSVIENHLLRILSPT